MKKRAFVRYSKQGKIVPGSLILTGGSHPSGPSTWKEVPADLCCDTTAGKDPFIMNVLTSEGFFEFGMRGYSNNTIKGIIYWGDGTSESFDLTGISSLSYLNHTYTNWPEERMATVTVYFTSTNGFRKLEIGTGDVIGVILSVSGLPAAFANSEIQEVDVDFSNIASLDVSNLPIQNLYALECQYLRYLNVNGCTNLVNTQLYGDDFVILNFKGCTALSYIDVYDNPNLVHINIDDCPNIISLDASDSAIQETSVDYLITTLDNNGLTNGSLILSGGTNSAPSVSVAGNITSLTSKGWNVLTN